MRDYNKISSVIVRFIDGARIAQKKEVIALMKKLGLENEAAERHIKKMCDNGYIIAKDEYLVTSSNVSVLEYTEDNFLLEKINTLFINLFDKVDYISRDCKFPCRAVLANSKTGFFLNIFYISKNYANDCNLIETCYATKMTEKNPINTVLILDDEVNKNDVFLSDNFNVTLYCQNGKFFSERG